MILPSACSTTENPFNLQRFGAWRPFTGFQAFLLKKFFRLQQSSILSCIKGERVFETDTYFILKG